MSTLLWKYYFENDVENFRHVLARAAFNGSAQATRGGGGGKAGNSGLSTSPGTLLAASPTLTGKTRKQSSEWSLAGSPSQSTTPKTLANVTLSRADINWRDGNGVTLLHQIASSYRDNASDLAKPLLQLPLLDLYSQDEESGWTALHRALYFGNITIARALMDRDIKDEMDHSSAGVAHGAGGLIKIKDREGNSPFDVYGASITNRDIRQGSSIPLLADAPEDEESELAQGVSGDANDDEDSSGVVKPRTQINGDEIFAFGSNKNFTLGLGDEDDRQFPERIFLKRPESLLRRLYDEHLASNPQLEDLRPEELPRCPIKIDQLPALVRNRPIIIQDVQLSKLHSAVLTMDPEANLYVCGFGSGGRLGTGDEITRFGFVNVHGGGLMGKKVILVGLGQNHTIAVSSQGETYTWGSNAYGQLGYASNSSPSGIKDEEPVQLLPRQVFGPLKREVVVGASASRIHSVVHTSSSLYTFGKNEGQLGLVDSDARSLTTQNTPRKVAASLFSSAITAVSAIDRATICLLENHDVWVFANYGYTKMAFPLETFSNYFLPTLGGPGNQKTPASSVNPGNTVCKITSGGDSICAMSSMGDVFTVHVTQKMEASTASASTTNPAKIRGALSPPQRVWSLKKGHMAVRDVDVGQDGSIIICTESGSVWRRVKRAKIKDASAAGLAEYRAKDYKFSRVPGLTRITAVRSNTFGAYAAVRLDCDVLKTQLDVESNTLWRDFYPLLPFHGFAAEDSDTENPAPRFWTPSQPNDVATIRRAVLTASNLEDDVASFFVDQGASENSGYDLRLGTTLSDVRIPLHEFVFAGRGEVVRNAFAAFRQAYFFSIPEIMTIEYDKEGRILVLFQGVDFITVLDVVLYIYTDSVVDVWHHTKHAPESAFRYRQIRTELMRIASNLELRKLEQAVRVMTEPPKTLPEDFKIAIRNPRYFDNGDVEVELDGESMKVHRALMCQRCPFFEGLFQGRAAGGWLSSRREQIQEPHEIIKVDLKHVDPNVFGYVLRHLYADTDERMFDDVVTADLDGFLDLILEVMSVANELMLDRLAQCCQKLLGRFVNTRNVCQLLNAVAPCSVSEFKEAALEYICLNLEGMLENHLLGELDEDLMLELDGVVRQNQLNCLPISKSGRLEAELIEEHPELVESIERSKRVKIDSVSLQTRLYEREARSAGGSKARASFLEDFQTSPSGSNPQRRSSKDRESQPKSPLLKAKKSAADLMFEMDNSSESEADGTSRNMPSRRRRRPSRAKESPLLAPSSFRANDGFLDHGEAALSFGADNGIVASSGPASYSRDSQDNGSASVDKFPLDGKKPWALSNLTTSKLDMKDIMAQATPSHVSNISAGLSQPTKHSEIFNGTPPGKMSQRERKRQQQRQQQSRSPQLFAAPSPDIVARHMENEKPSSPWQTASRAPKVSLKDVLGAETGKSQASESKAIPRTPSPMTLRQTVSGKSSQRSTSGPAQVLASDQQRSISSPDAAKSSPILPSSASRSMTSSQTPSQFIRHANPPVEPSLQLSMADILSQQHREKEIIKEAAAKRSLQEIQEEQAFQEWWDQESRKMRDEEEERRSKRGGKGGKSKGRGRSRGMGRGGGVNEGGSGGGKGVKVTSERGRGGGRSRGRDVV